MHDFLPMLDRVNNLNFNVIFFNFISIIKVTIDKHAPLKCETQREIKLKHRPC